MNAQTTGLLALAVAFDLTLGEPPAMLHPVVWMGHTIGLCVRWATSRGPLVQLFAGAIMALAVPAVFASGAWLVMNGLRPHPLLTVILGAILLKTTFALRALDHAAHRVREAVAQGRIADARSDLRSLCSRDASGLEAPELIAATIESVAENMADSFVAPLLWFALFGLPGAVFYRAVNTMDAMVGYHGRFEWLGKPAARLDDVMNLVPSRVTAWLLIAGGALAGFDARRASRVLARDGARTASPNAGRPMAAMAGLLGVELSKAGHYRLGDAIQPLEARQIDRASRVTLIAAALATLVTTLILEGRFAFSI
jgi:adenosylcobinamide-phosphate synthase